MRGLPRSAPADACRTLANSSEVNSLSLASRPSRGDAWTYILCVQGAWGSRSSHHRVESRWSAVYPDSGLSRGLPAANGQRPGPDRAYRSRRPEKRSSGLGCSATSKHLLRERRSHIRVFYSKRSRSRRLPPTSMSRSRRKAAAATDMVPFWKNCKSGRNLNRDCLPFSDALWRGWMKHPTSGSTPKTHIVRGRFTTFYKNSENFAGAVPADAIGREIRGDRAACKAF